MNACTNCIDRHIPTKGDQVRPVWILSKSLQGAFLTWPSRFPRFCRSHSSGKATRLVKSRPTPTSRCFRRSRRLPTQCWLMASRR
jgi:hypothetical protein